MEDISEVQVSNVLYRNIAELLIGGSSTCIGEDGYGQRVALGTCGTRNMIVEPRDLNTGRFADWLRKLRTEAAGAACWWSDANTAEKGEAVIPIHPIVDLIDAKSFASTVDSAAQSSRRQRCDIGNEPMPSSL